MGIFSPEVLLGRGLGLLVGFTLHEWAHAWAAYRLGDRTAYYQGRLTLDPRAHIDPMGILLALFAGFGWAKPVPVNPRAFHPNEKQGLMIVSLAGPLMNLLIAAAGGVLVHLMALSGMVESVTGVLVGGGIVHYGVGTNGFFDFLYGVLGTVVIFNLVLFLFNLLPLAPLDGYKIAVGVLPPEYSNWFVRHERETTFVLLMLLMIGLISPQFNILWGVLGPILDKLYQVLVGLYPVFG